MLECDTLVGRGKKSGGGGGLITLKFRLNRTAEPSWSASNAQNERSTESETNRLNFARGEYSFAGGSVDRDQS